MKIAPVATPTEIVDLIEPAVLFGNHVFNVKRRSSGCMFGKLTIFAPPAGPIANESAV
jgi:hypothetical protein